MATFDAIVLGLGGMGSAAAYHLARRGKRVLGLEQFVPAHDRGSSHGHSRIYRQAYMEGAQYVPLLLRAYDLWRELERESGRELLRLTGGLMIGPAGSRAVDGARRSAEAHGISYHCSMPPRCASASRSSLFATTISPSTRQQQGRCSPRMRCAHISSLLLRQAPTFASGRASRAGRLGQRACA